MCTGVQLADTTARKIEYYLWERNKKKRKLNKANDPVRLPMNYALPWHMLYYTLTSTCVKVKQEPSPPPVPKSSQADTAALTAPPPVIKTKAANASRPRPADTALTWELALVGESVDVPGAVWLHLARDEETKSWARKHGNEYFQVRVLKWAPNIGHAPGQWLVQHQNEKPFHLPLHHIWPNLDADVSQRRRCLFV